MPIKPVDYQVILPRTPEVSKLVQEEQQKNQALQQQQALSTQQKADQELKQVHAQGNVQEAKIREQEKKNPRDRKENKKKNKQEKDEKTSTIDIRL